VSRDIADHSDFDEGFARLPDGGRLAYQVHGRQHGGIPALLIRPMGGSMALWGSFRAELARELCIVAFDLRGTGGSSADPARVTTERFARDGLQVLTHLGIPRAHIFGISLGGMAATWLAILAPERVARLCIASAPARGLALSRAGLWRQLGLAVCFAQAGDNVEARLVERILSRGFRDAHPGEVRRIAAVIRATPASRTALFHHALAGALHDARRNLHRVAALTLVLAGENDRLLGTRAPRALADGISGSTFATVPRAGHDLTLEQPVDTAERVAQFFLAG